MFPIILAQDASTPQELDELRQLTEASWQARPYWAGLMDGGPLYLGLHVLMLLAAALSISLALRRGHSYRHLFLSILPFALGASAMWLRVLGLTAATKNYVGYEGSIVQELSGVPRPFYLGITLSAFAFCVIAFLPRRAHATNIA